MEKIIPTIGVLIVDIENVLLVRHTSAAQLLTGSYGLPAGRIEKGETEKMAAVRELREETGLTIKEESLVRLPTEYKAVIERKDSIKTFSLVAYKCTEFEGNIQKNSTETNPEWVPIKDISKYDLLVNVGNVIKEGLQNKF